MTEIALTNAPEKNLRQTQIRFALFFAVLLYFCSGIRACDNGITFGFPVIGWEHTDAGWHISKTNILINLAFTLVSFFGAWGFAKSKYFINSHQVRFAAGLTLVWLAYQDICYFLIEKLEHLTPNSLQNFKEFLVSIALTPILLANYFIQKIDFRLFMESHPNLLRFYPHHDDLNYRICEIPAIVISFFIFMGAIKLAALIRTKFIKEKK